MELGFISERSEMAREIGPEIPGHVFRFTPRNANFLEAIMAPGNNTGGGMVLLCFGCIGVVELITSTFPGITASKEENTIKLSGKGCND